MLLVLVMGLVLMKALCCRLQPVPPWLGVTNTSTRTRHKRATYELVTEQVHVERGRLRYCVLRYSAHSRQSTTGRRDSKSARTQRNATAETDNTVLRSHMRPMVFAALKAQRIVVRHSGRRLLGGFATARRFAAAAAAAAATNGF